jgi:hypothetical protein
MPRKPTQKQQAAADGVLQGKSRHRAYLDAGYAPSSAKTLPYDPLENSRIRELMHERSKRAQEKASIHTDVITGALVEIMEASPADILPTNKVLLEAKRNGVDHLIKKISVTPMKLGSKRKTLKDGSVVETPVIGEKIDLEMYSRLDAISQLRDNFGMKQEPRANTFEATRASEVEKEIEKIAQAEGCDRPTAARMLKDALGSDSPLIPTVNKYVN